MNSLEGYNTDGFEYRASQMDRNRSQRLKWMMKEAKEMAEKREKEENKVDPYKKDKNSFIDKDDKKMDIKSNNNSNSADNKVNTPSPGLSKPSGNGLSNNVFRPSEFNRVNTFRNNLK